MSDSAGPTAEEATALFQSLEQKFPSKTLGEDRWYIVAVILSFYSQLYSLLANLEENTAQKNAELF